MTRLRKQIIHLTPAAVFGGCEVNCLRIIRALSDCDHIVVVFGAPGPMSAAWEAAGARVEHLNAWEVGLGRFSEALAGWGGAQAQPDAAMYWSSSRVATVLRILDHWNASWTVYLGNPLPGGIVSLARRLADEWIQAAKPNVTMVACSEHVAASHRRAAYFRRFSIAVIYNAVDQAFDRDHVHRLLGPGSAPVIGMVARLDRIKDHKTLLGAVAAIRPVCPGIVLEFVGDGPLRRELEDEARRLKVEDIVKFLGFRPVAPLLPKWDIYVHSTTGSEGMGTAVAEAMLSGLPCLVSDLDVMREVCGEEGAVFAQPGNVEGFSQGILRLIRDRSLREKLGGAARSRARQLFTSSRIGSAYARLVFPDFPMGVS